jgi:prepilin-type N-terminal cleavage/methylation domain-containing protein
VKNRTCKIGLTLIEMLIVVAIIAILVTMVIGIAAHIDNQGKEQLTENTFALLGAALGQFQDYGYNYKVPTTASDDEREFYRSLNFPLDCNGLSDTGLEGALENALGLGAGSVSIAGDHNDMDSGSEALYFFLSRVPHCRGTLEKIDKSLITNEDSDGDNMIIKVDDVNYPLMRFIDPWGETLRYDYYDETASFASDERMKSKKTFPVITSAGPDRDFDTVADNITSKD